MKPRMPRKMTALTTLATIAIAGFVAHNAHAQLMSSWTPPSIDDGAPVANRVKTWLTDVETDTSSGLPSVTGVRALAADAATGRVYAASGSFLTAYVVNKNNELLRDGDGARVLIEGPGGSLTTPAQISAMGFARGMLYASISADTSGLYTIDPAQEPFERINVFGNPEPAILAQLVRASTPEFPFMPGMDYNSEDQHMYAIRGPNTAAEIVRFDLDTLEVTSVIPVPQEAYGGLVFSFDGVAVANGKVYLTGNRTGSTPIPVFDLASGTLEKTITGPQRLSENTFYDSGATFLPAPAPAAPTSPVHVPTMPLAFSGLLAITLAGLAYRRAGGAS